MGAEFCQSRFLHLLRWSYGFYLQFVDMVYHCDWFAYIEESLHPWNKPNLTVVYEHFDALHWSLKFCWGFLHLCSSVTLTCSFHFLCCLCLVLVSGVIIPKSRLLQICKRLPRTWSLINTEDALQRGIMILQSQQTREPILELDPGTTSQKYMECCFDLQLFFSQNY